MRFLFKINKLETHHIKKIVNKVCVCALTKNQLTKGIYSQSYASKDMLPIHPPPCSFPPSLPSLLFSYLPPQNFFSLFLLVQSSAFRSTTRMFICCVLCSVRRPSPLTASRPPFGTLESTIESLALFSFPPSPFLLLHASSPPPLI